MKIRRYSELVQLESLTERYEYLRIPSKVGIATFGFDRYLNQRFYRSREWKLTRDLVIVRDNGNDLGVDGFPIHRHLVIHHMNPITVEDIEHGDQKIFDPEFLITVSKETHQAIHFGDRSLLPQPHVERRPGDTNLWSPIKNYGRR